MAIDVLFINPGNQAIAYQDLAREFTAVDVPIWALLLAGSLRRQGYECAVHDINVQGWDKDIASNILRRHRPRLVVMLVYGHHPSASTQTMPAAHEALTVLKAVAPEQPVALGGTHPTVLPQLTLSQEPADYVVCGEALHSISGLVDFFRGKRQIEEVPGLWHRRRAGGYEYTGDPPIITQLAEDYPEYAWDLLCDISKYRAHNWHCFQDFARSGRSDFSDVRSPYASLYTSLGCPYDCDYCCIHVLTNRRPLWRHWPIESVVETLESLRSRFKVRNIRFADELFILQPKRVELFCDLVISKGLDLNIWAYGRVDTIPDSLLPKMKKAGINWICLGIEAGNQAIRSNVNKALRRNIVESVCKIQESGIYVIGNFMFGLPGEDENTMQDTLDLAIELNCEFVNFYSVMPYPGSRLYEKAMSEGAVPERWEAFSQHSYWTQPLPTGKISSAQVLAFRDNAFETYFRNPRYRQMVQDKFGDKVVAHIDRMLGHKIRRRLLETSKAL